MSNDKKLKELKIRYLHMEHPHWAKEQWHKKINEIFREENKFLRKFSVEEAIIRNLEFCYTAPTKRIKCLMDLALYSTKKEEKENFNKIIKNSEQQRLILFKRRVKENLEWYNSL